MTGNIIFTTFVFPLLLACSSNTEPSQAISTVTDEQEITALKIENLLRDSIGLADGVEVIMSYLETPKNTTLPAHYHPGEEFVYMLEGSGELTLKDQPNVQVKTGDVVKIPLKHIHSFSTMDKAARAVVFRVHEQGQPDRIAVD